jgi:hypothetical protein
VRAEARSLDDPRVTYYVPDDAKRWSGDQVRVDDGDGKPLDCQANASAYVRDHPGARYAQGILLEHDGPGATATPHAWAVDPDGTAVEVTLGYSRFKRRVYVGAVLPEVPGFLRPTM